MIKRLLFLLFAAPVTLFAQNSYDLVFSILNTKCSNSGCHSATSADALKFDGTSASVYSQLINQPPMNTDARTRGERLVWPDQPYQSYLLKRAGSWFDTDLELPAAETTTAHTGAGLTNKEVEYIRQWVMNNAKQTGTSIDTPIINAFYNDTIHAPFFPKLPRPAAGTGIQVRFGPLFLRGTNGSNEEEEMLMNQINFPSEMEITGVQGSMSSESHHFLLFKFDDSVSAMSKNVGLRAVNILSGVTSFDGNKGLVAAWQTPNTITLPSRTAFFWPQTTYLDLNYHIKNYTSPGNSGVMPFDFYLNITMNPRLVNSSTIEMKSQLVNNAAFIIPPHSVYTNPFADPDNGTNETRYLWMMSSHTHKYGVGFNIFEYDRTKPNNIGDTLYVGTYDYNSGASAGFYDWEHPPVEYFVPQRALDMKNKGVICKTTWNNTSSGYQHFGLTTNEEMQLYYYMYTLRLPSTAGVNDISNSAFDFAVYPNPMTDMGTISYTLSVGASVRACVSDITGKEIAVLKDEKQQTGTYNLDMGQKGSYAKGMYFATVSVDGQSTTRKFIVE